MSATTHRCSIALSDNDFLTDQPDGTVYATHTEMTYPLHWLKNTRATAEITYHRENGYSPNCVLCRDECKQAPAADVMRKQMIVLEASWSEDLTKEQAKALFRQMTDLQGAIEKADGRRAARDGSTVDDPRPTLEAARDEAYRVQAKRQRLIERGLSGMASALIGDNDHTQPAQPWNLEADKERNRKFRLSSPTHF